MGAIIRNHKGKLIEIGGMPDHVHLLIELSSLDKYSDFLRDIKASSSLWIHKTYSDLANFGWQEGFGSFSVSYSALDSVKNYIQNQILHHATMTFDEEYLKFLKLHNVKYDDRFVLG
jgi:REP element-mobilizing transposase RayT